MRYYGTVAVNLKSTNQPMALSKLRDFNILVVDSDLQLAKILKDMLVQMGFANVNVTANGMQALEMLHLKPIDFMITEWNTREIDGLELLNRIRRDRASPDQTLPIIMLTGRAEKEDVIMARDFGINEYVVKPFTAKTVYSRLERLIEAPKQFVLSQYYIGPDRRNKTIIRKDAPERRKAQIKAQLKPPGREAPSLANDSLPKIWLPDYKLKLKLGAETSLSSVITATQLVSAQQTIEDSSAESMGWLQENLNHLRSLQQKIKDGNIYTLLPIDMSETALIMSSRAGTFGYASASKVSYLLYLFCRNNLNIDKPDHQMVAAKHIDALRVALDPAKVGTPSQQDNEIVSELRILVLKYAA